MDKKKQQERKVTYHKLTKNFEHTVLTMPLKHISRGHDDHISVKLIRTFNHWLNIPEHIMQEIIEITSMIQITGLLVDDMQDNSLIRNGIPTAHVVYGFPITINSAYYISMLAMQKCIDLNQPKAVELLCYYVTEMTIGQGMEIYWRDNFICPNEESLLKNAIKKCGCLFLFAIEVMQLFSDNKFDFTNLLEMFGCHYQIYNDYVNLCSESYQQNKGFCEDMTEGKFSYPIVHAIKTRPDDIRVMNIIRQKPTNDDIKKYCLDLLHEFGSIKYTEDKMADLYTQELKEIEKFGGNPKLINILGTIFKEAIKKQ